jgi:thiamine pyrophosphokinase
MMTTRSLKSARIGVIANAPLIETEKIRSSIAAFSYLVAVDGGSNHCHNMGLRPDLIIGDMDSAEQATLDSYAAVPKIAFPRDKDKTDLEIALEYLFKQEPLEIVIFGGLNGRIDHLLGNIYLLTRYPGKVFLESHHERIFIIDREVELSCHLGQIISLIPMNGAVTGVTTDGLKWELTHGTFDKNFIGISNEVTKSCVKIQVKSGDLLCVINKYIPTV